MNTRLSPLAIILLAGLLGGAAGVEKNRRKK